MRQIVTQWIVSSRLIMICRIVVMRIVGKPSMILRMNRRSQWLVTMLYKNVTEQFKFCTTLGDSPDHNKSLSLYLSLKKYLFLTLSIYFSLSHPSTFFSLSLSLSLYTFIPKCHFSLTKIKKQS